MEIEKLFNERFKDFQPEFSEGLKAKIGLEAEKKAKSIRQQRLYKWLFPSAGIGAIAIAASVWYIQDTNPPVTNASNQPNNPASTTVMVASNNTIELPNEVAETLDIWETPVVSVETDEFKKEFIDNSEPEPFEGNEEANVPSETESSSATYNTAETKDEDIVSEDPVSTESLQSEEEEENISQEGSKDEHVIEPSPNRDVPVNNQPKSSNLRPAFPNTPEGWARYEAYKLKNGALLVRLKTSSRTINALEEHGYTATARKKREEVFENNKRLYDAFKDNFAFSKVYFFYATDSDSIRNGVTKGIFLNEKLERDPSIELSADFFMIADIGAARETARSVQEGEFRNDDILDRVFVLSNSEFKQLEPPFPYYKKASWPSADGKNLKKYSDQLFNFMRGL